MLPMRHIRTTTLVALAVITLAGCVPAPTAEQAYAEGDAVPISAQPSEAVAAPSTVPTRDGGNGAYAVASDAEFQQIISDSSKPVLVYFSSAWCRPCQVFGPAIDELAREQAEQVRIVTVEPNLLPLATHNTEVRMLPTLALFKEGRLVNRLIGGAPKWNVEKFLQRNLAPYP
jgi:thioredoxin-like negative regulator of GroEL